MKKIICLSLAVLMIFSIMSVTACDNKGEEKMKTYGTVVNCDSDFLWYIYEGNGKTTKNARQQMIDYVDSYANHGISDMVYCIFCQSSVTPTEKWTWFGEKVNWTKEGGFPVDYDNVETDYSSQRLAPYYEYYTNSDIDPVEVILEETKAQNMNAWLSFRMNDCHSSNEQTSFLRGREFYTLDGEETKVSGNRNAYFDECFNYESEIVRNKMLAYLTEQINRYDMDGIELDFTREMTCFNYWTADDDYYCLIMDDFIKAVKKIIDARAKELKHDVKLSVRLFRDIEQCKVFGFDAKNWVDNGYVDVLCPAPRWGTSDSDMPIASWVEMCKDKGVEVWAGQELILSVDKVPSEEFEGEDNAFQTAESAKALASSYYSAGADKAYLFNYFNTLDMFAYQSLSREIPIWEGVSSPEKANEGVRANVVTYQELDTVPKGYEKNQYNPLPLEIENDTKFNIQLGEILDTDEITIYFVFNGVTKDNNPTVKLDGVEFTLDLNDKNPSFDSVNKGVVRAYKSTGTAFKGGKHIISFGCNDIYPTARYIEVKIVRK